MRNVTKPGEARKWMEEHVAYQGDGCLTWPFSCDSQGYADIRWSGKTRRVARVMCELVNGPPPTPLHHAAHTCGKGHEACVHPKHVKWKTPTANQLDRAEHGTGNQPGQGWRLTADQVATIRALRGEKTQRELAAMFGIRWETIGQIQRGTIHADRPKRYGRTIAPADRLAMAGRARVLRAEGKSLHTIAETMGVSRGTVKRLVKIA